MIGTLSRCINSLQLYDDDSSDQESSENALEDASLHLKKVSFNYAHGKAIKKCQKYFPVLRYVICSTACNAFLSKIVSRR